MNTHYYHYERDNAASMAAHAGRGRSRKCYMETLETRKSSGDVFKILCLLMSKCESLDFFPTILLILPCIRRRPMKKIRSKLS